MQANYNFKWDLENWLKTETQKNLKVVVKS